MDAMGRKPKRTQLVIEVVEKADGRRTVWPVECPDECEEVAGVNPITREKGKTLAMDHLNRGHGGLGIVKVRWAKGRKRRG